MKQSIRNALPIVAAAYGEQFGVKVVLQGNRAHTDGKCIVLPALPDDFQHHDAVWGLLGHEAGHIRYSDSDAIKDLGGRPLVKTLTNIFEDGRIERQMLNRYPGMKSTFEAMTQYMVNNGLYEFSENDPVSVFTTFVIAETESRMVGLSSIESIRNDAGSCFDRHFSRGVSTRLEVILRRLGGMSSSSDARALAELVVKMLQEEQERQEDQDEGNGQSDESDSGQGQQSDEGSGEDAGGSPSGQQSGSQRGSDDAQNGGTDAGGSQERSTVDDLSVIDQLLSAGEGELPRSGTDALSAHLRDLSTSAHSSVKPVLYADDIDDDSAFGSVLLKEVQATSMGLQAQLRGLIQASSFVGQREVRAGRRVNGNKLSRVLVGDTRIFRRHAPRKHPNTAVHMLLDMSGSMCNARGSATRDPFVVAREAALALALALDGINGVNPAVTAFQGGGAKVHSIIKHGEKPQAMAGKFSVRPSGSTPMAEAVWYAAYQLLRTKEDRKILLLVTDGEPDDEAATRHVVDLCIEGDVEVYGIGIGTKAVERFSQPSIVIADVQDLRSTLFTLIAQKLAA